MSEPERKAGEGRLSILVVEDEALVLMSLAGMLEELGHEPLEASNAAAAMSLLRGDRAIHVMITDINLPDMQGPDLVEQARGLRPRLPVIFSSGYRVEVSENLANGGPTAVLGKPYWVGELEKALRQVR